MILRLWERAFLYHAFTCFASPISLFSTLITRSFAPPCSGPFSAAMPAPAEK
jgi:hypothetical protein